MKSVLGLGWKTNLYKVELELVSYCNLNCINCDRSCRQLPTGEMMTVEQVRHFVLESLLLKYEWKQIRLLGGEPTLHPQFFEILDVIKDYKNKYPKCKIHIISNGVGDKVNDVLSRIPDWVEIRNSAKESYVNEFTSYNLASIDLNQLKNKNFHKGCWITNICGLGLSRYGYYSCGAGASVDRVFCFNIGIKNLKDVNNKNLNKQKEILCKYCGHFKDNFRYPTTTTEDISKSWKKAYNDNNKYKKYMSLY